MDLKNLSIDCLDLERRYNGKSLIEIGNENGCIRFLDYAYENLKYKYDPENFLSYCENGNFDAVYCCIKD